MSERKSAEIKFRCTPSFKAFLQTTAEAASLTMSEYIESAVHEKTNAALTARKVPSRPLDPENETVLALDHATHTAESIEQQAARLKVEGYVPSFEQSGMSCRCRPWEFCTHKASA